MSYDRRRARTKKLHGFRFPQVESLERRQLLTALTFGTAPVADGTVVPQNYGNRVQSASQDGFTYGTSGGPTPNVTVGYGPVASNVYRSSSGYGDLSNAIYPGLSAGGLLDIRLSADLNFEAQLNSIDLAGANGQNYTIKSITLYDGADHVLFSQNNVLVAGSGHTHLTFPTPTSRVLRLRIDTSNLGANEDKVALDNIDFSQITGQSSAGDGFADVVLGYYNSGAGLMNTPYGGVNSTETPQAVSLGVVLGGDPGTNVNYLSLPTGSSVTVGFADETVVDGPGADLVIRELANNGERAHVYVSSDGVNFTYLGLAKAGRSSKFDLASIGFTGVVRAVKVVGLNNGGASPGFDLVNVQAMTHSMRPADDISKGFVFAGMDAKGTLSVSGTSGNDLILLSTTMGMIDVMRNGQTMSFDSGITKFISINAGAGNDKVGIGSGIIGCYVFGGDGNDSISGGAGNDTLSGGAGKNALYGNGGDDRLNGSGSRDYLVGGLGNDRLYGNGGNDTLIGGPGVDHLFGGDGNDILYGGSSNDKLYGGAGDDTLIGQGQSDLYDGGPGIDTAYIDKYDWYWTNVENIIRI